MSTPNQNNNTVDRILQILTTANAAAPIAIGGVSALIGIFKSDEAEGKTDAEIEAQWNESMGAALRTRDKVKEQTSDRP